MTDLRERVAHEIHLSKWWTGGAHKARRCATRILALVDAEYRPLLEATLAVLECGIDPGPHHMDSLDGRAAWIDRMKPVREQLRTALSAMKEKP